MHFLVGRVSFFQLFGKEGLLVFCRQLILDQLIRDERENFYLLLPSRVHWFFTPNVGNFRLTHTYTHRVYYTDTYDQSSSLRLFLQIKTAKCLQGINVSWSIHFFFRYEPKKEKKLTKRKKRTNQKEKSTEEINLGSKLLLVGSAIWV
jgi:hypothetical protein